MVRREAERGHSETLAELARAQQGDLLFLPNLPQANRSDGAELKLAKEENAEYQSLNEQLKLTQEVRELRDETKASTDSELQELQQQLATQKVAHGEELKAHLEAKRRIKELTQQNEDSLETAKSLQLETANGAPQIRYGGCGLDCNVDVNAECESLKEQLRLMKQEQELSKQAKASTQGEMQEQLRQQMKDMTQHRGLSLGTAKGAHLELRHGTAYTLLWCAELGQMAAAVQEAQESKIAAHADCELAQDEAQRLRLELQRMPELGSHCGLATADCVQSL